MTNALLRAAAGAATGTVTPPATAQWPGHQPGRVYLGTNEDPGRTVENTVQDIGQDLGLERESWTSNVDGAEEDAFIAAAHARNRIPWISWKAAVTNSVTVADWASIVAGTLDADITARANRYKAAVNPIIVTWNSQPDKDGTTATHATNFRTAFKRIADLFVAAGATNVAFVPIMSDSLFFGETVTGSFGTLTNWLDTGMLDKSAFLGLRVDKTPTNQTYADRIPAVLTWLDGQGYPTKMVGLGHTAGYSTTVQTGAAWWASSWTYVENNASRIGAVAYFNSNGVPPPPEI